MLCGSAKSLLKKDAAQRYEKVTEIVYRNLQKSVPLFSGHNHGIAYNLA